MFQSKTTQKEIIENVWVYDLSPKASLPATSLPNQVRQPYKFAQKFAKWLG